MQFENKYGIKCLSLNVLKKCNPHATSIDFDYPRKKCMKERERVNLFNTSILKKMILIWMFKHKICKKRKKKSYI